MANSACAPYLAFTGWAGVICLAVSRQEPQELQRLTVGSPEAAHIELIADESAARIVVYDESGKLPQLELSGGAVRVGQVPEIRLFDRSGAPIVSIAVEASKAGPAGSLRFGDASERWAYLCGGPRTPSTLQLRDTRPPEIFGADTGLVSGAIGIYDHSGFRSGKVGR